jgi:hypothetical protein
MVLKIENEMMEILQSIGVQQGNNMNPILFLFLILAAAAMLEVKWCEAGIKALKVAHTRNNKLETGYVYGHTPYMYNSAKLTAYNIIQFL